LVAKGTDRTSRLQITANKKGVVWLDQVSLMPSDTYKVSYTFIVNLDTEKSTSKEKATLNFNLVKTYKLKVSLIVVVYHFASGAWLGFI
jgi:hypothetical protein